MDYTNYHAWHVNKSTLLTLVCSKVNLVLIPRHTWWINFGSTTYISVSMWGCLNRRKSIDAERFIYVDDVKSAKVDTTWIFRFSLKIGYYLDLKETIAVSSFRRNSVSIFTLDKFGYFCSIRNSQFNLFLNSNSVDTSYLSGYITYICLIQLSFIKKYYMWIRVILNVN